MLASIARVSYRHRRLVLLGWVAAFIVLSVVSSHAGTNWTQSFSLPGTDSQAATDLLQTRFPSQAGTTADIVFKADAGVADPAVQARLEALFAEVKGVPQVTEVVSPYAEGGQRQISGDGTIAYAEVHFDVQRNEILTSTKDELKTLISDANGNGLQVEGGGDVFTTRRPPGSTEAIGILAAVVILLVAFGSLLAMGLPIMTALVRHRHRPRHRRAARPRPRRAVRSPPRSRP